MLPEDAKMDPLAAQEALDQLVALGYVERPDGDIEKTVTNTVRELRYNLGRSYMDGQRHRQAIPLFQGLFEEAPDDFRCGALRLFRHVVYHNHHGRAGCASMSFFVFFVPLWFI